MNLSRYNIKIVALCLCLFGLCRPEVTYQRGNDFDQLTRWIQVSNLSLNLETAMFNFMTSFEQTCHYTADMCFRPPRDSATAILWNQSVSNDTNLVTNAIGIIDLAIHHVDGLSIVVDDCSYNLEVNKTINPVGDALSEIQFKINQSNCSSQCSIFGGSSFEIISVYSNFIMACSSMDLLNNYYLVKCFHPSLPSDNKNTTLEEEVIEIEKLTYPYPDLLQCFHLSVYLDFEHFDAYTERKLVSPRFPTRIFQNKRFIAKGDKVNMSSKKQITISTNRIPFPFWGLANISEKAKLAYEFPRYELKTPRGKFFYHIALNLFIYEFKSDIMIYDLY